MKRFLLIVLLGLISQSCSQKPVREDSGLVSVDQFKVHFPTENVRLRGILSLDHLNGDLSRLDYSQYRQYLENLGVGSKEVLLMLDASEERLFESSKTDYVVCLKNLKMLVAVCDDSATAQLDLVERGSTLPQLKDLKKKIK